MVFCTILSICNPVKHCAKSEKFKRIKRNEILKVLVEVDFIFGVFKIAVKGIK